MNNCLNKSAAEHFNPAAQIRGISGRPVEAATLAEYWLGLSEAVIERLAGDWYESSKRYESGRMEHYFSSEFLMGRSLENNLVNLGLYEEAKGVLKCYGKDISDVLNAEPDANLGNGGLGRLAACFLDSCANLNLPVYGYGILYRYGLFKQIFEDGFQEERPDSWMEDGYPFVIRREEEKRTVRFRDLTVNAIPYDMPISSFNSHNVNTLRLWKAESPDEFDFELFNEQRFTDAIKVREQVADISRVLYPNDSHYQGKLLRLRQQYFFVSASLQSIVDRYVARFGEDFSHFAEENCFQLNDTHPVLAIPELMRLLMDEHGQSWDMAWAIVSKGFAYTNHTILPEALETWEIRCFEDLFPRILEIVREIDRRQRLILEERREHPGKIDYMSILRNGRVNMAWLACRTSFSINGVAAIHSEIIKRDTLKDWYSIWPEKFNNKTNGVTPRRWLRICNPRLSGLLTELSGNENWVTDLDELKKIEHYANDSAVLERLSAIKQANKEDFAAWIKQKEGIVVRTDAVFDVQIKRLHEYKRQLLNILEVLDLYFRIKEGKEQNLKPRLFIFGAKAAPGYLLAKSIIKLINEVGFLINRDPQVREILQVLFIQNYNVSAAERIIPAADVSEQISLAGKEASGTGNMKFMMNGALTLGTMDGANVEIADAVGPDHVYIFGARVEELPGLRQNYEPKKVMEQVEGLSRLMAALTNGVLPDQGKGMFNAIRNSLLEGDPRRVDPYYVLGDFQSYREARSRVMRDYLDAERWNRSCWVNICRSGRFSSDRTISDYNNEIWKLPEVRID